MVKIFSVASNARREARKLGLDTATEKVAGGYILLAQKRAIPDGVDKVDHLQNLLTLDWQRSVDLEDIFGMPTHKVRAVIAHLANTRDLYIQTKNVGGMVCYRVDSSKVRP